MQQRLKLHVRLRSLAHLCLLFPSFFLISLRCGSVGRQRLTQLASFSLSLHQGEEEEDINAVGREGVWTREGAR